MTSLHKLSLLLGIGIRNPLEFLDRLEAVLTVNLEKMAGRKSALPFTPADEVDKRVESILGRYLKENDFELNELELHLKEKARRLDNVPFTFEHNADVSLARRAYTLCRILKPEVVLETGVAYGMTTAFILKALFQNGCGVLHSIDLPPLGDNADASVGILAPDELKDRWVLHRGASKRILPKVLAEVKTVNVFVHDSLHTYWNIKRELELVLPYLSRPSVVLSDDIEGNIAFHEWAGRASPAYWAAIQEQEKESALGVAVFSKDQPRPLTR